MLKLFRTCANQFFITFSKLERYLRDQRASYNHYLSFTLQVTEQGPQPTTEDIVLEGAGQRISVAIFSQENKLPSQEVNFISFFAFSTYKSVLFITIPNNYFYPQRYVIFWYRLIKS